MEREDTYFYILLGDHLDLVCGASCIEPEKILYGAWELEGNAICKEDLPKVFPDGMETLTQLGEKPPQSNDTGLDGADYSFEPEQLVSVIISAKGSKARAAINEAATLLATGENIKYNSIWGPAVAVFQMDASA